MSEEMGHSLVRFASDFGSENVAKGVQVWCPLKQRPPVVGGEGDALGHAGHGVLDPVVQ